MDLENLQPGDRIFIQFTEEAKANLLRTGHPKLDFEGQWLVIKNKYTHRELRESLKARCYEVETTDSLEHGWPADGFLWTPFSDFLMARSKEHMSICFYTKLNELPEV